MLKLPLPFPSLPFPPPFPPFIYSSHSSPLYLLIIQQMSITWTFIKLFFKLFLKSFFH
ncbi:unnamed protein product [Meloidogyne enterolobii]|uniref:Uncharacterized protein n=1 Tax=Meloidogyne enterolobii TaxID=390850 RepID=A0ACB0YQK6_MELEN